MSFKALFSRSLSAAPGRLHFAAHSHHLWPDASRDAQIEAWDDAARLADRKWDRVLGEVLPQAQRHVADELHLPDPATIAFSGNTHDLVVRLVSALPMARPRVLASDGEFYSFQRQALRWAEAGRIDLTTVPLDQVADQAERGGHDLIYVSQVQFNTGQAFDGLARLAALAAPDGPWVVIDGYHGFMATPTDLAAAADRVFYLGGGYKYAMAGEGVCFLHAPPGFAPRPEITGWYAEFADLSARQGGVGYAPDGRRFWGSTFEPTGLYRFNAVRRMLEASGLTTEAVSAHCADLRARFTAADPLPALRRISGDQARFLALRGQDAPRVHADLADAGVVTDLRGDVLRIGFGLYQDHDDVDALIARCRA